MNYEKSCGAVIYNITDMSIKYLLIKNQKGSVKGHWGFAKGHVEACETEEETAKREILEETGLSLLPDTRFRTTCTYSPKPNVTKEVVYFVARYSGEQITLQESEVSDYIWLDFNSALQKLTFAHDILRQAHEYIQKEV